MLKPPVLYAHIRLTPSPAKAREVLLVASLVGLVVALVSEAVVQLREDIRHCCGRVVQGLAAIVILLGLARRTANKSRVSLFYYVLRML